MSMLISSHSQLDNIVHAYEKKIKLLSDNCFKEVDHCGKNITAIRIELNNTRFENNNLSEIIEALRSELETSQLSINLLSQNNQKLDKTYAYSITQYNHLLAELGIELSLITNETDYKNIIKQIRDIKEQSIQSRVIIEHEQNHRFANDKIIQNLKSEISIIKEKYESSETINESYKEQIKYLQTNIENIKNSSRREKEKIIDNGKKILKKYRQLAMDLINIISSTGKYENYAHTLEINDKQHDNDLEISENENEWIQLRNMVQHQTDMVKSIDEYKEAAQILEENNTTLALKYENQISTLRTEVDDLKNVKSLSLSPFGAELDSEDQNISVSDMIKTMERINKTLIVKYPTLYDIISLRNMHTVRGQKIPDEVLEQFFSAIGLSITNNEQLIAARKFFEAPLKTVEIIM